MSNRMRQPGMISRRQWCSNSHQLLILIVLPAVLSFLAICHGFQTVGRTSSRMVMMSRQSPPSRRNQPSILASSRMSHNWEAKEEKIHGSSISTSSTSSTRSSTRSSMLFPQRKSHSWSSTTLLPMATTDNASGEQGDSSKDVSDKDTSPLVKVWLSFRKLMARLWTLLLKPFQLLKSLLTASKIDKDNEEDTALETEKNNEPIQEEVAITQVENIAALEEVEEVEKPVEIVESNTIEKDQQTTAAVVKPAGVSSSTVLEEEAIIGKADKTHPAIPTKRQATSSSNVDLTGNWTLIVDETFTSQYDEYLRKLGQPMLVRTVALTVIGSTKEETIQSDGGQKLFIRGMNVRGSWERTLEASEQDPDTSDGEDHPMVEGHELKPMTTADGEEVSVASWWETNKEDGVREHHSWVVGGKKYGGGDFENKRYLTDNGNILVCESTFHPVEEGREKACVTWRFLREGAIYGDAAPHLPNIFDVLKKDEDKKKGLDDEKEDLPESGVIVGDIMDDVTTSDFTDNDDNAAVEHSINIEEAIERESWVPPSGNRWAIAAPNVDLSGKWKLIITEQFKKDYDVFLTSLGQPAIVRGAAVVLIGNTREETIQRDSGRVLYIKGINAKGIWERTLTSSGSDFDETLTPNIDGSYGHIQVPILTADSEKVVAESWWEDDGTVHVSWTYGVKSYGGGSFESKRYLENGGDVYVCESTFHPDHSLGREKSYLKWKFLREGAAFMLADQ